MRRALCMSALAAVAGCAPEAPTIALGGPPSPVAVRVDEPAPHAPAKPEPPRPEPAPIVVATTPDIVRDQRFLARGLRSPALLITETQGLESLFASTPQASLDRPRLIRRLADNYAELAAAAARDGRPKVVSAALPSAIRYYEALLQSYPGWCASPNTAAPAKSTGCADEALYYRGLAFEQSGDDTNARRMYFLVIQNHPTSRLVPSAYLAFGELFLAESNAYPSKLAFAEQSYLEVLKYPPPDNVVYGYAELQLGQVYLRKGDQAQAVSAFKAAVAWAKSHPAAAGGAAVSHAAMDALAGIGATP